jgi:hypothetical protein
MSVTQPAADGTELPRIWHWAKWLYFYIYIVHFVVFLQLTEA